MAREKLRIAVASNFATTAKVLLLDFERQTEVETELIIGSSGKLASQIELGFAVDVFFSADTAKPKYLAGRYQTKQSSTFKLHPKTYAYGQLVLWTPVSDLKIDQRVLGTLKHQRVAIANPKTAPYGLAAMQTLDHLGLSQPLRSNLVYGENVAQAMRFALSGNARFAFLSLAQAKTVNEGSFWVVPQTMYEPIEQQMLALNARAPTQRFMTFMQGESTQALIASSGYKVKTEPLQETLE